MFGEGDDDAGTSDIVGTTLIIFYSGGFEYLYLKVKSNFPVF